MINDITLSFTQALQMVALAPCISVILYLVFASRNRALTVIPILYFISLASGLLYYLLPAFIDYRENAVLQTVFAFGDMFVPTLSFLIIFQFMLNRVPPLLYWTILAAPAIATGPFVYEMVRNAELCLSIDVCFSSVDVMHLNNVVISSFIFILLVLIVARRTSEIIGNDELRKYKYWLVVALIIYNIIFLMMDLLLIKEYISHSQYIFARAMVKIAFIYMVMTSIFRVFTDLFDVKPLNLHLRKNGLTKYEQDLAIRVIKLLEEEKIYRSSGFNRAALAKELKIGEHLLSNIINIEFKKSFSDIANEYRIKEAKELLSTTVTPITSIAFDVGFNSIASFNRVFKGLTGKSPTQYRDDMNKAIV
jgi:AraC-like DNA-binding protein